MTNRTLNLDALVLDSGNHRDRTDGVCVMEAVAWFAGEKHSDRPRCASLVLTGYAMGLNDRWDDTQRQRLIPFIPRIVGTRCDGLDETRSYMALDWLIRTYTPAWLDLAGLTVEAQELRGLRRIVDLGATTEAEPVVRSAQIKAAVARAAAAAGAAVDAARAAAWVAAVDAVDAVDAAVDAVDAVDAAGDAARDAARDAAWAAARAAAWVAAGAAVDAVDAAGDAARAAARAALRPTVETLQSSALDLLDRMIDGRWETAA